MLLDVLSTEDGKRIEAKLDKLLKLLETPALPSSNDEQVFPYRTREWLLLKLDISKTKLLELEKEEHFTPICRGQKTYYHTDEIRAYMQLKGYRKEAIERKISA